VLVLWFCTDPTEQFDANFTPPSTAQKGVALICSGLIPVTFHQEQVNVIVVREGSIPQVRLADVLRPAHTDNGCTARCDEGPDSRAAENTAEGDPLEEARKYFGADPQWCLFFLIDRTGGWQWWQWWQCEFQIPAVLRSWRDQPKKRSCAPRSHARDERVAQLFTGRNREVSRDPCPKDCPAITIGPAIGAPRRF
jgi:hypothetical protein